MADATKRIRSARRTTPPAGSVPPRVSRRGDVGLGVFTLSPEAPVRPATNPGWIAATRRFARGLVWALPLYACCYGIVTLGRLDEGNPAPFLTGHRPAQLVGWLGALWLGLAALLAIGALLAGTHVSGRAVAGLMVAFAGVAVMLPFVSLPGQTPLGGVHARDLVLAGAGAYSLGWLLTGWAVTRCGMLAPGDGITLMVAAPMLGVAGLVVGPLQTVGALLAFAAGLNIAWRASRLLPAPPPAAAS